MLNNSLASSSLPKREVLKCFKSSLHTMSQVFTRNHAKYSRNSITSVQRSFCKILRFLQFQERNSNRVAENIVHKVWREFDFFYAIWPILLQQMQSKARQDKMFILTLMLYRTSKSCKIQVAKSGAYKQQHFSRQREKASCIGNRIGRNFEPWKSMYEKCLSSQNFAVEN